MDEIGLLGVSWLKSFGWDHLVEITMVSIQEHSGGTQETLRRHSLAGTRRHKETPRRHPGITQETPRRQAPRRHPDAPRRHQKHPGITQKAMETPR